MRVSCLWLRRNYVLHRCWFCTKMPPCKCTGLVGNLVVNEQLAITNLPHDWWTGQWILFSSFFSSNYFLWQSKKSSIYRCVCSELPDSGKLQLFGRRLLFSLWGKFAGVTTARLLSDKRSLYPHNFYNITMISLSKVLLSILPLLSKLFLFERSSHDCKASVG